MSTAAVKGRDDGLLRGSLASRFQAGAVRYLGIEVDDALTLSEQVEL